MQISGLQASGTFAASDVLAIEINGTTYKLTGTTLASALQSIGGFLTGEDVVNDLTGTDPTKVLAAPQGKVLIDAIAQSTADVIRTGDVVNNLTSTATDKPLSAAQGKALNDIKVNAIQTQLRLPSAINIPANNSVKILDNVNLRNLTHDALDPIPASGTIVGVQFLWANNSVCVPVDTIVASNTSVSMVMRNVSTAAVTVSAIRLLVFIR